MHHAGKERIKVTTLHRMDPSDRQGGYWYYSPDGHCIGPFDSALSRDEHLAQRYEEPKQYHCALCASSYKED